MKKILFICICLFISLIGYSQDDDFEISTATVDPDWNKSEKTKGDIFWATVKILDSWDYVTTSKNKYQWYISKKPISKSGNYLKTSLMIYMPSYTDDSTVYKDVVVDEIVLFDCFNKEYKILEAQYHYDFTELFDVIENKKPKAIKILSNSVMGSVLKRGCK